jgi:hypothetical protein
MQHGHLCSLAAAIALTPVLGEHADEHREVLMPVQLAALTLPAFLHEQAVRRLPAVDREPYVKIDALATSCAAARPQAFERRMRVRKRPFFTVSLHCLGSAPKKTGRRPAVQSTFRRRRVHVQSLTFRWSGPKR